MNNLLQFSSRKFASFCGICKETFMCLWSVLQNAATGCGKQFQEHHLIWTLYWLKNYPTIDVASIVCGVDQKTFEYWIWHTIFVLVARLNEVVIFFKNK
jgi:hypothetical protein